MKQQTKKRIILRSEWIIIPALTAFCLGALGNVSSNWGLPGVVVFTAQSVVIVVALFSLFHIGVFLSVFFDDTAEFIGPMMGGLAMLVAIPLSFFWGWVLFILAFIPLFYHIGVCITMALDSMKQYMLPEKETATPIEIPEETTIVVEKAEQA